MKHVLLTILFIAISGLTLASCSTSDDGHSPSATQKSIAILFEGDTHCEVGGYSLFAGLRDAMQHADTAHVVTVSLGDFMVGYVDEMHASDTRERLALPAGVRHTLYGAYRHSYSD
jgi:hypothetical protein